MRQVPDAISTTGLSSLGGSRWVAILVGTVFTALATVELVAQIRYSAAGWHESGTIVSTDGGIGRKKTVDAHVAVAPANAPAFTVDVEDTFNRHGWKEGASIDLLCTRLHADHTSCVAGDALDRYAFPCVVLTVGLAIFWAGTHRRS